MSRRHRLFLNRAAFSIAVFIAAVVPAFAFVYTPINYSGNNPAHPLGIDGSNIVGNYTDGTVGHGFLYNGSSYTTLDDPLGIQGSTSPHAIYGHNIVGTYTDALSIPHGFIYDGTTYTTLDDPLGNGVYRTVPYGISGDDTVGFFSEDGKYHGFLYSGAMFTTLDDPMAGSGVAQGTFASGIEGGTIVGTYIDALSIPHGFIYNGTTYKTLDDPLGEYGTNVWGISAGNIVGMFSNSTGFHGFLFDGASFVTIDIPAVTDSAVLGISGNRIIGTYTDSLGVERGYTATVPEPSSLILLLGVGPMGAAKFLRRCRLDR
jgi:PEP-CTERM motif